MKGAAGYKRRVSALLLLLLTVHQKSGSRGAVEVERLNPELSLGMAPKCSGISKRRYCSIALPGRRILKLCKGPVAGATAVTVTSSQSLAAVP